jgi:MtN3 and saliva related transmembrane protein
MKIIKLNLFKNYLIYKITMQFKILDPNVNLTMNIFLVIGNIINIIQNVPQIIKTYKTKSTKDFSGWFLLLRIIGNIIWTAYAISINSMLMIINNMVTILSSSFIGYYKIKEIINERRGQGLLEYKQTLNDDNEITLSL